MNRHSKDKLNSNGIVSSNYYPNINSKNNSMERSELSPS